MGSDSLSTNPKLPISLTDVFTSRFTVSSNAEHFGAAQGGVSASIVHARDFHITAHRLETASFTVNIPIRCFTHATGRNSADEQKWLKVVSSIGRRRVGKALLQARNRIHFAVHPVQKAPFPGKIPFSFTVLVHFERVWQARTILGGSPLSVYVTPTGLHLEPIPLSTHSILPVPLSTSKSAVSLGFDLVYHEGSGPSLRRHRGVGATGAVLAHSSLLVLEGSRISDRDLFVVGTLSTCCEAPLARARLKPSEHHPTNE